MDVRFLLQKADDMAAKNCWCAALWWATKTLELDPDYQSARELFTKAFANTTVGFAAILARNKENWPSATKLLKKRNLDQEHAKFVADVMISILYLELIQKLYHPLLERFNKRDIQEAARIPDADLKSAREMALAIGDELLPGQETLVRWKSLLSSEADSFFTSGIATQKETLVIILQANSPLDWSNTCQRLHKLWAKVPNEQKMTAMFEQMGGEQIGDTEFGVLDYVFGNYFPANVETK